MCGCLVRRRDRAEAATWSYSVPVFLLDYCDCAKGYCVVQKFYDAFGERTGTGTLPRGAWVTLADPLTVALFEKFK